MALLRDKVAVITGGSRGLGLGIAHAYAREGAAVVVGSRSADGVRDAVSALRATGARADGLACDVGSIDDLRALADCAGAAFGAIDVWVNNAGLAGPYGPSMHVAPEEFERVTRTNVFGTYYGSLVAMERFVPRGHGKLINLTGRGDRGPAPMQNAYGASKAWIRCFTLALAEEYDETDIGIFAFSPGLVATDMLHHVRAVAGYTERVEGLRTVARMWGNPPAVPAERAVWLASSATDGRTGLEARVLTRRAMVTGIAREAGRRLLRRPSAPFDLEVTTVEPAM